MTLVRPAIAPARLVVRGARVLDPRERVDGAFDLVVIDGRLVELAPTGGGLGHLLSSSRGSCPMRANALARFR